MVEHANTKKVAQQGTVIKLRPRVTNQEKEQVHEFTQSHTDIKDYRGYRLLAVNGSDLHIAAEPTDKDTYFQRQPNTKGCNLLHLNEAYELDSTRTAECALNPL